MRHASHGGRRDTPGSGYAEGATARRAHRRDTATGGTHARAARGAPDADTTGNTIRNARVGATDRNAGARATCRPAARATHRAAGARATHRAAGARATHRTAGARVGAACGAAVRVGASCRAA